MNNLVVQVFIFLRFESGGMGLTNLSDGTPSKVSKLADREVGGEYGNAFNELLEFLGENFVENGSGDVTIAVPSYNSLTDSDSSDLAQKTSTNHDSIVVVNGEVNKCIP